LEIEVREAIFHNDPDAARGALERLTALGCGVTLDDFGAGHAAISYLCETRFSAIKLDRALIRGAAHGNAESVAMIRAAVALADSLEMVTIAKGVESDAELQAAFELSCGRIQGHAYGGPMALDEVKRLFGGGMAKAG
jgi:EAL domain-containing protein (putative c-di-GMP-specific phosphodiesterase class I)